METNMKRYNMLVTLIAMLSLITLGLDAQLARSSHGHNTFYFHTLANAVAYANSQTDTIPNWDDNPTYLRAGGAKLASLTLSTTDSCEADIYVETRVHGATSYTTIITDSLKTTTDTGTRDEWFLRSSAADTWAGIDIDWRIRIAWRASKNGTSSPAYTVRFNYVP